MQGQLRQLQGCSVHSPSSEERRKCEEDSGPIRRVSGVYCIHVGGLSHWNFPLIATVDASAGATNLPGNTSAMSVESPGLDLQCEASEAFVVRTYRQERVQVQTADGPKFVAESADPDNDISFTFMVP